MKYIGRILTSLCFLFLFLVPKVQAEEEKAVLPRAIIEENVVLKDEEINKDVFVLGKNLTIEETVVLKKNLVAMGGNVIIDGKIDEYLIVFGGDVVINGEIGKNLIVLGGKVLLNEKAVVEGYSVIMGGQVEEKGIIKGEKYIEGNLMEKLNNNIPESNKRRANLNIISLLGKFLVLIILVKLAGKRLVALENLKRNDLLKTIFQGFLFYIIAPLVAIILFITIIGAPLAMIMGGIYFLILYLSPLLASVAIGKWTKKIDLFNFKNELAGATLGFLILNAVSGIPVLGGLIMILAQLWGVGFIWGLRKSLKS